MRTNLTYKCAAISDFCVLMLNRVFDFAEKSSKMSVKLSVERAKRSSVCDGCDERINVGNILLGSSVAGFVSPASVLVLSSFRETTSARLFFDILNVPTLLKSGGGWRPKALLG